MLSAIFSTDVITYWEPERDGTHSSYCTGITLVVRAVNSIFKKRNLGYFLKVNGSFSDNRQPVSIFDEKIVNDYYTSYYGFSFTDKHDSLDVTDHHGFNYKVGFNPDDVTKFADILEAHVKVVKSAICILSKYFKVKPFYGLGIMKQTTEQIRDYASPDPNAKCDRVFDDQRYTVTCTLDGKFHLSYNTVSRYTKPLTTYVSNSVEDICAVLSAHDPEIAITIQKVNFV